MESNMISNHDFIFINSIKKRVIQINIICSCGQIIKIMYPTCIFNIQCNKCKQIIQHDVNNCNECHNINPPFCNENDLKLALLLIYYSNTRIIF